MHVYILFAHPSEDSFNRDVLDGFVKSLGEARMEILGGMMPQDDTCRQENLEKVYDLGRTF